MAAANAPAQIYPNGTQDHPAYPCVAGCLYDIQADPTEHVDLSRRLPAVFESMRLKLLAAGKTLYQTDYAEPGTGPATSGGEGTCISGPQARAYYTALNVQGQEKAFIGPMCFKAGELPPVPPVPPPPPSPSSGFRLTLAKGTGCLKAETKNKAPITLSTSCVTNATKRWNFVTPKDKDGAVVVAAAVAEQAAWLALAVMSSSPFFAKVNTSHESAGTACKLGYVYTNSNEQAPKNQGFVVQAVSHTELSVNVVKLVSSLCPGMCLSAEQDAEAAHLAPCATAAEFKIEF